jgi:hypothetical protein
LAVTDAGVDCRISGGSTAELSPLMQTTGFQIG